MAMRSTTFRPKSGFSLIELAIVAAILAIGAAVVAPKWTQSLERAKVRSAVGTIENDLAALRSWSVRHGVELQVSVTPGTSEISISPPVPELLGDASGTLDYSNRFPGLVISDADFDNDQAYRINVFGDLLTDESSAPLSTGLVTISGPSSTQTIDLLAGVDSGSANNSGFNPVAQSASSSNSSSGGEAGVVETAAESVASAASVADDTLGALVTESPSAATGKGSGKSKNK